MRPTPPITPDVWRKTFALCSLFFALGIAITCFLLLLLFHKPAGTGYADSFQTLSKFRNELTFISLTISSGGLLLTLAGVIFITVLYSHRIAGPAYRLAVISRMAGAGTLDEHAHFRKKDFIQPLAEEMNAMLRQYSSLMDEVEQSLQETSDCGDTPGHGPPSPQTAAFLSAKLEEIETALSHYKV